MPPLILAFFTGTYSVFDGCAACPHGVIEHALGMHGCLATGCEYSYVMNWDGTACVRCPENWDFVSTGTCAPPHANASSLGVACGEWGYVLNWDGSACVPCPENWIVKLEKCVPKACDPPFVMGTDGVTCVPCPKGWQWDGPNQCSICPAGSAAGATACSACSAGTFSTAEGSTSCSPM